MTPAAQAIAANPILRPSSIRCRSLTVRGCQCSQYAMLGHDLCYQHAKFRHLVLPRGPNITLPLFEDLDSVRVFLTQISQGLLADKIDFRSARSLFYGCQVASNTMPRPARLKPAKEQESPSAPVTEVFEGPDGQSLGPIEDARKTARFDNFWSFEKYKYEEECERLGRPLPQTPADMPESGWLNPDDLDSISHQRVVEGSYLLNDGYRDKMLQLHLEADRLGKLPPIAERRCVYDSPTQCVGPAPHGPCYSPCDYCERERDEYLRLHPDEDPLPVTGLKACAEAPDAPPLSPPLPIGRAKRQTNRAAAPSTPCVESVNTPKLRRCNQLPRRPSQGGTRFSQKSPLLAPCQENQTTGVEQVAGFPTGQLPLPLPSPPRRVARHRLERRR